MELLALQRPSTEVNPSSIFSFDSVFSQTIAESCNENGP